MDQQANIVGVLKMWAGRPGAQPRLCRSERSKPRPARAATPGWPWGQVICTD